METIKEMISLYDYSRMTEQEQKNELLKFVENNYKDLATINTALGIAKKEIQEKTGLTNIDLLIQQDREKNIKLIRKYIPYIGAGTALIILVMIWKNKNAK